MIRRPHPRPAAVITVATAIAMLLIGVAAHRYEIVRDTLWVLGFWTAISLTCGAIGGALKARQKTLRQRTIDRELREAQRVFNIKIDALIGENAPATPYTTCVCPSTAAGLDLCDRCPGRTP